MVGCCEKGVCVPFFTSQKNEHCWNDWNQDYVNILYVVLISMSSFKHTLVVDVTVCLTYVVSFEHTASQYISSPVCEVVQSLQLFSERDPQDFVGDLSVCLDGMQVDPETFTASDKTQGKERKSKYAILLP